MGVRTVFMQPEERQPGAIVLPARNSQPQYLDEASAILAAEKIAQARGEPMVVYVPVKVAQPERGATVLSLAGSR
jgi:LDH2 family malate/lactate/ureidoglycolate dehydrogenase